MKQIEIHGLSYAVEVFNEMLRNASRDSDQVMLVWQTSLGIAKVRALSFDRYHRPALSETAGFTDISQDVFEPSQPHDDIFSAVRKSMFDNFHNDFGYTKLYLTARPDFLLSELQAIVAEAITDKTQDAKYQTVWDFETIDESIQLPFVAANQIELISPVSLISKNSTDNE